MRMSNSCFGRYLKNPSYRKMGILEGGIERNAGGVLDRKTVKTFQ